MFLSVVIPTYNRLPILEKCLRALERQRLAAPISDYEVVVVDDGSTDETVAWLGQHQAQLPHVRWFSRTMGDQRKAVTGEWTTPAETSLFLSTVTWS